MEESAVPEGTFMMGLLDDRECKERLSKAIPGCPGSDPGDSRLSRRLMTAAVKSL
jgi:hypothetical protein